MMARRDCTSSPFFLTFTTAMTQHENHSKHHGHQHEQHHQKRKGFHKDWRAWLVVGLMLAAMLIYVFTKDESIRPGSNTQGPVVPAAP
jgi:hypothetical protein